MPTAHTDSEARTSSPKERTRRRLVASLVGLVAAFVALVAVAYVAPSPGKELSFDQVYALAERNQLQSVRFLDEDAVIIGKRCLDPPAPPRTPAQRPRRCYDVTETFHASYPSSAGVTQQLIDVIRKSSGATIVVDGQADVAVMKLLATFVFPLLMLANLFGLIFMSRGGDSSLSEIVGFGRIGRKGQGEAAKAAPAVTFADVAGAGEAVAELREVIDYLTDPARFQALGAAPPKGVLLFGPPGCGKTLMARATAGESGVPFFSTSGTEFVESLVGVGAARVRDLFRQVRAVAPAILFIDEIDAVGRRRSGEGTSGGEREQTLNQLLVELDGFEVSSGIVLMGATNRPDILDPALLRPGRFDRHITLEAPDIDGRLAILELHAKGRPLAGDVNLAVLAARTPGFTGADLANVVNESALLAIREEAGAITAAHLSEAVLRVLHGPQRRGRILSPEERRRLAVHEAGHAVVAAAVGHGDEVHRLSIVSRSRGLAQSVVGGDATLFTAEDLEGRLAMAMGGVAAEVSVLRGSSTTAHDDISRATRMAKEMVGSYGMSPSLGRVRLLTAGSDGILGGDDATLDLVSGPTMAEFDAEVRRLVSGAEDRATSLLKANSAQLDAVAAALLDHETLEGAALARLLGAVTPVPASPNGSEHGGDERPRRATRAGRSPDAR